MKKAHKKGILDKKEYRYLIPEAPKLPVIYQLPKIHKDTENPPGRPIISGIDSLFSQIGEYLDVYLQPLVKKYPAYLKDSKQLINLLKNLPQEEEVILATIDVESLYTNINQKDAISAVKWALEDQQTMKEDQKKFLLKLLKTAYEM